MMQDWKEDSMSHVDEGTLHAYLDGELPPAERTALETHIAECATCRATLTEERALRERASAVLGSARPAERPAPPLEQLRRESKRSPWRVRRSFAWAASIALALGVGYYMRSPAGRMAPSEELPQPLAVAQNRAVATAEDKAVRRTRVNDRRASQRADEVDSASKVAGLGNAIAAAENPPTATAGARAQRVADSLTAVARQEQPTFIVDGVARQLPATDWPVISRRVAKTILGEEPVGLPGLETRTFRRDPGTNAVVVEQALDSSTVIQIFQRPAGGAYPYDSSEAAPASVSRAQPRAHEAEGLFRERGNRLFARFVRGLRVEIKGPLSADSLNRLLEQVAPLP
jgi:anti-sigma factor RsiW